jgi:hypothetical protein
MQPDNLINHTDLKLILDFIQTTFTVFGSIAVGFAVKTYYYNKKQDNKYAAIDQVTFFREKIISISNDFMKEVRKEKGENYEFARIKLDNPDINFIITNYKNELDKQFELKKYQSTETDILNLLEELSLKIRHYQTEKHEALNSIKIPFVSTVEILANTLLYQRFIATGIPTYSTILEIYNLWKDSVDRREISERMEEFKNKINRLK